MFYILFISFGFIIFVFEERNHFFNVIDMVIETVDIIYFFSNLCSNLISFSNGADGYNPSVFWSICIVKITLICVIILNIDITTYAYAYNYMTIYICVYLHLYE